MNPRILTVTGQGNVDAPADKVVLAFNVSASQHRYSESVMVLNEKVERLRQVITHQGLSPGDLKTTSFNISPNYELVNGQRVLSGFAARHGLRLELPFDKQRLNAMIDGLAGSGSESNFSITFTVEDTAALQKSALQAAVADAAGKAAVIAEAAGVQLGGILKIDYSRMVIEFDTPSFDRDCSYSYAMGAPPHPDIEPDDVSTGTAITVVWALHDQQPTA